MVDVSGKTINATYNHIDEVNSMNKVSDQTNDTHEDEGSTIAIGKQVMKIDNPQNTMTTTIKRPEFWRKLRNGAHRLGRGVAEKALWLYYASGRPETPIWARTVIIGALSYFILPVDAIPDFVAGAGYTDDLSILAAAVATVSMFINDEVKNKTDAVLQRWFPKKSEPLNGPNDGSDFQ
jgi:uncharacterized membrane protein YkvA (DUF1232 family)